MPLNVLQRFEFCFELTVKYLSMIFCVIPILVIEMKVNLQLFTIVKVYKGMTNVSPTM